MERTNLSDWVVVFSPVHNMPMRYKFMLEFLATLYMVKDGALYQIDEKWGRG